MIGDYKSQMIFKDGMNLWIRKWLIYRVNLESASIK
jgi:hypothetical protein